ncbi:MAG: biotin-dependent carboxyltransferase family protein [Gammaproteobacteria bacterium]|nr:biotin-dependent carboxyltransferase family protein [Gammaproteobacteria bacterium]
MTLTVLTAGPLSLLQDPGRRGHQHLGVSCGGPMDEHAFNWANHLLGNLSNAVQIEITLGPFRCRFDQATVIALTGADMLAKLNGKPISGWQSHCVQAGDHLELGVATSGLRAYLAVSGGFQTATVLGSAATVLRDQLGGRDGSGKPLGIGDTIEFPRPQIHGQKQVPAKYIPSYARSIEVAVIPGYQYAHFTVAARERFFCSIYTVSTQIDRMGYRLSGPSINYPEQTLYSEGVALGSIQIPADGQPIVLMRDRQTIGGYPKIGCVTAKDLSRLAQCLPGSSVQFYKASLESAQKAWLGSFHYFNK